MNLLTKSPLASVAALGALYLALSPRVAVPVYRPVLFRPDKYPNGEYHIESLSGIKREDVFFPSANGKTLHGWFFEAPNADKTILFSHGNAGNIATRTGLLGALLETGASVFTYDYQGFGRSEGSPNVKRICQDGLAAYRFLTKEVGIDSSNIINYGESLGSAVACYLSRHVPTAALILQSGFCSLARIGKERVPFLQMYPDWLFPQPDLNNLAAVRDKRQPLLIIHGMLDDTVPFAHGQELFAEASEPKRFAVLPNAGHIDMYDVDRQLYINAVKDFLHSLSAVKV